MRGSALAGPAPRPLHDFESSARGTGQDPSGVVRRERDRHVVLGRDRVARLRHLYGVPRIHNVETSIGCGGAGRSTGSSDCDKRSLPEGRRCPNRRLRPRSIGWDAGISNSATSRFVCAGNTASTRPSEVSGGPPPGRAPLETRLGCGRPKGLPAGGVCAAHSRNPVWACKRFTVQPMAAGLHEPVAHPSPRAHRGAGRPSPPRPWRETAGGSPRRRVERGRAERRARAAGPDP